LPTRLKIEVLSAFCSLAPVFSSASVLSILMPVELPT